MMERTDRVRLRLHDILSEIEHLREATTGLAYETFESSWIVRRAAERAVEVISEAPRHIPDDLKQREPHIPWRQIAGIGNVLRHDYENISSRVIWDIMVSHLDSLESATRRLSESINAEDQR